MDSFFSNIGFIILAIVIFTGRAIIQARKKRNPPPKKPVAKRAPPKPKISVHFEDDKEPDYFRAKAPARVSRPKAVFAGPESTIFRESLATEKSIGRPGQASFDNPYPKSQAIPAAGKASPEKGYARIGQLSPLKQAVIMAEILGPPKSLQ